MAISLRGCGLSDKPSDPEMYDLETCLVVDMQVGLEYAPVLKSSLLNSRSVGQLKYDRAVLHLRFETSVARNRCWWPMVLVP